MVLLLDKMKEAWLMVVMLVVLNIWMNFHQEVDAARDRYKYYSFRDMTPTRLQKLPQFFMEGYSMKDTPKSDEIKVGFICPEKFGKYPVLHNCNYFIQCVNGKALERSCPSSLHFNIENKECDFPSGAKCPYECPRKYGLFPLYGDCSAYIECAANIPILKMCRPGEHWNRKEQLCVDKEMSTCPLKCPQPNGTYPFLDDCTSYILCQDGIAHLLKCPSGLFYGFGSFTCQPHHPGLCPLDFQCSESNSRFPVLGDCRMFLECIQQGPAEVGGTVVLETCPEGLLYNQNVQMCDEPDNTVCAAECPDPNGIFSVPGLCHFYKICNAGIVELKMCPSGLHFDPVVQMCDNIERAGCMIKCPMANGTVVIPGKCEEYGVCTDNKLEIKHCPANLHWNHLLHMCDTPQNANCELQCDERFGLFPIPGRCKEFISCMNGNAVLKRCPDGLLFHPRIRMCAFAADVQCSHHCPEPDGIFPVYGDCSAFIRCSNNYSTIDSCGETAHFDVITGKCDSPSKVQCNMRCPAPNGRFVRPGPVTETFLECKDNRAKLVSCSTGLMLDEGSKTCIRM